MFYCLFLRFENNQQTVGHEPCYKYKYTEIDMHTQVCIHIHMLPVAILNCII